ncbi:MAG: 50S ribosomal protein L25/general stress protein Ctc [Saccharospirillaceae bacterium]|nr:50S ribosomal protein L25/general stress protein Ctc [Pseudomonadales bacterium]NRB80892.1 50S ribosomal protein L25/general stress protein Ctc [Saccharospirillaceae bacterium]
MSNLSLQVTKREGQGKGASRRLRHAGQTAGIIYGGDTAPQNIAMLQKDINKVLLNEAFYCSVISIDVDGTAEQVILVDLQRHPAKDLIMHADFLRVTPTTVITKKVPLHLTNEVNCVGVKVDGGQITRVSSEILITCESQYLPTFLEFDMLEITAGTVLHISDIKMPTGVQSKALLLGEEHNGAIISVSISRGVSEEDAPAAEAEAAAE